MAAKKLEDTPFRAVIISAQNPEANLPLGFVGGNGIVINGKKEIKHYKFQLDKEVSLPVPFIEQLKARHYVFEAKKGKPTRKIPVYDIKEV